MELLTTLLLEVLAFIAEVVIEFVFSAIIGHTNYGRGLFSLFDGLSDAIIFGKPIRRILYLLSSFLFGALVGMFSLLVHEDRILSSQTAKFVYVILVPILSGVGLCVISFYLARLRSVRRESFLLSPDKFMFGVCFAIAYIAARSIF